MQLKKMQVAPKCDGRLPPQEAMATTFGSRSCRRTFVTDLRSIVSAAHLLSAEVAPPASVWSSLRLRLEKEGILTSVKGRLEEHTRFPMFRN